MRHLELFAVAVIMAALSGCISLGSGQPGPPGPKGDSSNTDGDCSAKKLAGYYRIRPIAEAAFGIPKRPFTSFFGTSGIAGTLLQKYSQLGEYDFRRRNFKIRLELRPKRPFEGVKHYQLCMAGMTGMLGRPIIREVFFSDCSYGGEQTTGLQTARQLPLSTMQQQIGL